MSASATTLNNADADAWRPAVNPWIIAITVTLATFMEVLDTSIANVALPHIAGSLSAGQDESTWVLTSYLVSNAIVLPLSGWLSSIVGRKNFYMGCVALFTVSSFLCGLAPNLPLLILFRILQGAGGAMMLPVGRLTMVRTFAKSELVRAMSFVAIPGLIGPMLGPISGGLITGYFHWSVIFFVNVPIGLVGLYLVYRHLPDYRDKATPPVDIVGLILFSSGIALLSYVLEVFGEHTLSGREVLGLIAISAALLAGYGLHATHTTHPLLRLTLFRIRTFRAAVSGSSPAHGLVNAVGSSIVNL